MEVASEWEEWECNWKAKGKEKGKQRTHFNCCLLAIKATATASQNVGIALMNPLNAG